MANATVVDDGGQIEGLVSIFQLGEFFIPKPNESRAMRRVKTCVQSIIDSLNAKVLHAENIDEIEELFVRIGAMDIRSFGGHHRESGLPSDRSIIVVGDRKTSSAALSSASTARHHRRTRSGCRSGQRASEQCFLIVSPYDSATTSWIIRNNSHRWSVEPKVSCFWLKCSTRSSAESPITTTSISLSTTSN